MSETLTNLNEEEDEMMNSVETTELSPLKRLPEIIKSVEDFTEGDADKIAAKKNRRFILTQISLCLIANLSIISSGMGLGFPAISLSSLQNQNNTVFIDKQQSSWFASINMLTSPIGALLCSFVLDNFGRKSTLILINITAIVSWILMATASQTDSGDMFQQIMIARFIIGITTGLSSAPAAVYSAEISSPHLRGRLIVFTSFAIAFGILFIYTFGYFLPNDFRTSSWISCSICIFALIVLVIFLPESPSWLVMKGKLERAKKSLKHIHAMSDSISDDRELNKQIEILQQNFQSSQGTKKDSIINSLRKPEVYKPLGIMIGFFAFQQFSGIFVIVVYAVQFTKNAGVSFDPFLCAVVIGVCRIAATFLTSWLLDKFGRRIPTIYSGIGMSLCMLGLAVTSHFHIHISFIQITLIMLFIFISTVGFLTVPFTMVAEIYPQRERGLASGLTIFAAYTMSFVIVKLYPLMVDVLGNEFTFTFYGVISLFGVLYVYWFLPETKGKTLKEIENYFRHPSKQNQLFIVEAQMVEKGSS